MLRLFGTRLIFIETVDGTFMYRTDMINLQCDVVLLAHISLRSLYLAGNSVPQVCH